jgi:hypothetical protein
MPKADRIWEPLPCDDAAIARLTGELGVSPMTARLLCIRGMDDPGLAQRFLRPSLDDLHDPLGRSSACRNRAQGADRLPW